MVKTNKEYLYFWKNLYEI